MGEVFGDSKGYTVAGLREDVIVAIVIILAFIPAWICTWRSVSFILKRARLWTTRERGVAKLQGGRAASSTFGAMDARVALEVWLFMNTNWGFYIDALNALLSMLSCVLFVVDTYRTDDDTSLWFDVDQYAELFFGCYFFLDYLFRLYLAGDRLVHYFSPMALIDLVTLLPFCLLIIFGTRLVGEGSAVGVLRMLRIIRMARVLRIFRLERSFSGLSQLVFRIALTLLCLVFCAAGFFWVFETAEGAQGAVAPSDLPFHRVVYYCLIETIGRPRIPIGTVTGHCVLYALVIASAVLIPRQVASLLEALRTDSVYRRTVVNSRGWLSAESVRQHVIITGSLTFKVTHDFLFQFFHQDHGVAIHNTQVVLVSPDYPSTELRLLLRHPLFEKRVLYLQGSVSLQSDLYRARVSEAACVFVLAQKASPTPEQEDLQNIATVLTIKNYAPDLPVHVELLVRKNEGYLFGVPSWDDEKDSAICILELAHQLVARSAQHPGLSTLVANMFSSHHLDESLAANVGTEHQWLTEFQWGRAHEVYPVELAPGWVATKWKDLQQQLYARHAVVLIALIHYDASKGMWITIAGPSGAYEVQPGDRGKVLALDEGHAEAVSVEARSQFEVTERLRSRLMSWGTRPNGYFEQGPGAVRRQAFFKSRARLGPAPGSPKDRRAVGPERIMPLRDTRVRPASQRPQAAGMRPDPAGQARPFGKGAQGQWKSTKPASGARRASAGAGVKPLDATPSDVTPLATTSTRLSPSVTSIAEEQGGDNCRLVDVAAPAAEQETRGWHSLRSAFHSRTGHGAGDPHSPAATEAGGGCGQMVGGTAPLALGVSPLARAALWQSAQAVALKYMLDGNLLDMVEEQRALILGNESGEHAGVGAAIQVSAQAEEKRVAAAASDDSALPQGTSLQAHGGFPGASGGGPHLPKAASTAAMATPAIRTRRSRSVHSVVLGFEPVPPEELQRQAESLKDHVVVVSERWDANLEATLRVIVNGTDQTPTTLVLSRAVPESALAARLKHYRDVRWVQVRP